MKSIQIRGQLIGENTPAICVPVLGKTVCEIVQQAEQAVAAGADMIEWRADYFASLTDVNAVQSVLHALREQVGELPILFTIRTQDEGGNVGRADILYEDICVGAAGLADIVDVELSVTQSERIIDRVHQAGAKAIVSFHDFVETPESESLKQTLLAMEKVGADIAKIALMPQRPIDVARLLEVTAWADETLRCAVATMSMGAKGAVSRMVGEAFGSVMTFGSAKMASAPGQMNALKLREILTAVHESMHVD